MKRSERKSELRIVKSHLISVMDDLSKTRDRMIYLGCRKQAETIDSVVGKIYKTVSALSAKDSRLKD